MFKSWRCKSPTTISYNPIVLSDKKIVSRTFTVKNVNCFLRKNAILLSYEECVTRSSFLSRALWEIIIRRGPWNRINVLFFLKRMSSTLKQCRKWILVCRWIFLSGGELFYWPTFSADMHFFESKCWIKMNCFNVDLKLMKIRDLLWKATKIIFKMLHLKIRVCSIFKIRFF